MNKNLLLFADCGLFCFPWNVYTVVALPCCIWAYFADHQFWVGP